MLNTNFLTCPSTPPFANTQHKRREIRAINGLFSCSSMDSLLVFSPKVKGGRADYTFTSASDHFKSALRNWCHLLISGTVVLSSLHVYDIAYAIDKSKAIIKHPCEEIGTYYNHLEGLKGVDLAKRLNSIVSPHYSLPYKKVWEALKILDAADIDHPEISSDVIEVYTQGAVSKQLAGKSEGWNREHLWPRSYGLQKGPAHTDLHNIRPADVNVNSARGNKYYGECSPTSARCLRPAAREAASDTEADNEKWAPPIQERGDNVI
ncbi:Extracellular ribonuclease [Rhynchospora pubera]|uniref:Extracellular ribonuclease n=1 Tax=Rhynchospora pubera TaxID=906938 RepID=A0AAV8DFG4_9POAL|nr:Extracellular ribonuclease [Rhynchospora pubera]